MGAHLRCDSQPAGSAGCAWSALALATYYPARDLAGMLWLWTTRRRVTALSSSRTGSVITSGRIAGSSRGGWRPRTPRSRECQCGAFRAPRARSARRQAGEHGLQGHRPEQPGAALPALYAPRRLRSRRSRDQRRVSCAVAREGETSMITDAAGGHRVGDDRARELQAGVHGQPWVRMVPCPWAK